MTRHVGFRRTEAWITYGMGGIPSWSVEGWRIWAGPLVVARTPGVRPGLNIRWTR